VTGAAIQERLDEAESGKGIKMTTNYNRFLCVERGEFGVVFKKEEQR
jgi:hypothetical protein